MVIDSSNLKSIFLLHLFYYVWCAIYSLKLILV